MSCNHIWITNSGKGGEPEFRLNRQLGPEPLMHVRCDFCGARTWFTKKQWEKISGWDDTDNYGPSA